MIDTNFANSNDVDVYEASAPVTQNTLTNEQIDNLLEGEMDAKIWKKIARLAVLQIEMGLKQSIQSGIYNDQVVKTAMSAMKQAGKTFDEDAAKDLKNALIDFREASKSKLKAHKEEAISASMN